MCGHARGPTQPSRLLVMDTDAFQHRRSERVQQALDRCSMKKANEGSLARSLSTVTVEDSA